MARLRMRRIPRLAAACGALAIWGAIWGVPAAAGTLQINPVLVEIGGDRRTGSVTLRNAEETPVTIRAHALTWRQENGADRYEETSEIIVSPPIFTIPPGGTQLIRAGLRSPGANGRAYRLVIEEVPQAVPGTVQVALRLDLPLYASVPRGESSDLAWSAVRGADGGWTLEVGNRGAGYVRITPDFARAATGIAFENSVAFGTVLPGSTRRWQLGRNLNIVDSSLFQRIAGARTDVATASRRN